MDSINVRNVADRLSQPLLTSTPNLFDRRRNRERNANVIANVEMEPSSDSFGPINRTEVVSDKCGKLENLYKRKKHENDVLQKENIQLRKMQIEFNSKIQLLNEVFSNNAKANNCCLRVLTILLVILCLVMVAIMYVFKVYVEINLPRNGGPFV